MLATQITDHVAQARGRALTQYGALPTQGVIATQTAGTLALSRMSALISVYADQVQLLENMLFVLNAGQQLYNGVDFPAEGAQLDGLGALVQEPRNGLPDAEYLLFILATIAADYSDGTLADIGNTASILANTPSVGLLEFYPEEISVEIPTTAALILGALIARAALVIESALSAEVSLGYVASVEPNAFRFQALNPVGSTEQLVVPPNAFTFISVGGVPIGGGFADLTNPKVGGPFAYLTALSGGFGDATNNSVGGLFATVIFNGLED